MIILLPTEPGFIILLTVMSGFLTALLMVGVLILEAIGSGQITAGLGFLSTNGAGFLFITDAGVGMTISDGTGYQVLSGDLLGSHGAEGGPMLDGLRFRRMCGLWQEWESRLSLMICQGITGYLLREGISTVPMYTGIFFLGSGT